MGVWDTAEGRMRAARMAAPSAATAQVYEGADLVPESTTIKVDLPIHLSPGSQVSPVDQALTRLAGARTRLTSTLDDLRSALAGVLAESTLSPLDAPIPLPAPLAGSSKLADTINLEASKIDEIDQTIHDLLDRTEL